MFMLCIQEICMYMVAARGGRDKLINPPPRGAEDFSPPPQLREEKKIAPTRAV